MNIKRFFLLLITLALIDQAIKFGFANLGWGYDGPVISLTLAYNYGVAFSMFSFLQEYLKFIQLGILLAGTIYLYNNKDVFIRYSLPLAFLFAGGMSNILDRFTYGAVVDYIYWHYKFDFAIFNFADVIIDIAVVLILYIQYKYSKEQEKLKN